MKTMEEKLAPKIVKLLQEGGLEIMLRTIIQEIEPKMQDNPGSRMAIMDLKLAYESYKGRHDFPLLNSISTHSKPKDILEQDMEAMTKGFLK